MTQERHAFQAEVSRLLEIVTHSLYSQKEIFLRELISNASDACDKLRYLAQTQKNILPPNHAYKVIISADKKQKTITVEDTGIGMNKEELIHNLGTIAHSGTSKFLTQVKPDQLKENPLIGQFGVGFYASFMVANSVQVYTKKAGESQAYCWQSEGKGEFDVTETTKETVGTRIILHLKEGSEEYLEPMRLETIVKKYSDHINVPIYLVKEEKEEKINKEGALWTKDKNQISPQEHKDFYNQVGHTFDDPWLTIHYRTEGMMEYTALMYIPTEKPFDLFDPERKSHIKLYIKRVFITDNCSEVLPPYLRFLRGIIDAQDLPLNISREMLQHDLRLQKIKTNCTKKVLSELSEKKKKDSQGYQGFWKNFGPVLKEGLYEEESKQESILDLCLFHHAQSDGFISLQTYKEKMLPEQKNIYYLMGESLDFVQYHPQLEAFKKQNIDVLLLIDPIDHFWISKVSEFQKIPLKSILQDREILDALEKKEGRQDDQASDIGEQDLKKMLAEMKVVYGDAIKEVRLNKHLQDNAVSILDESPIPKHMMKHFGGDPAGLPSSKVLEINPKHSLIKLLSNFYENKDKEDVSFKDLSKLLLDQALIIDGQSIRNPKEFSEIFTRLLTKEGLASKIIIPN